MSRELYWSAARIGREILAGTLSSRAMVEMSLERIGAVNPAINAIVQLCGERALDEAGRLDAMAERGQAAGPLHGVPITVKDSLDTAGMPSTGGTLGRKDFLPPEDATVVARLRAAGAVLIGKSNTPELTFSGETNNLIYGRTNNPYDPARSPGGSSGGSAAVIACGGSFLELGSDTGGSIREPAHLCGITGIKPTSGRVPRTGHIVSHVGGVMESLTQVGPMARHVEDLALALPLISGPDGVDPYVHPVPSGDPDAVDLQRLRIGWYCDNGILSPCEDVARVTRQVADRLSDRGLSVNECRLPGMEELVSLCCELRESANAGFIMRLLERHGTSEPGPDLEGYLTEEDLRRSGSFDPVLLEKIDAARSRALECFAGLDAIVCPAAHAIARPHGSSRRDSFETWSYIIVHNLLGWPAGTVRAGTSGSGNLPVGVQVVAAPWREDIVLALMREIETLTGGFRPPPEPLLRGEACA